MELEKLNLENTVDLLLKVSNPGLATPEARDLRYGFWDSMAARTSGPANTTISAKLGWALGERVKEALEWFELVRLDSEIPEKT